VRLAKPCLDIGLYVRDIDASRSFYENELGLPYEELLKVGGGVHQHRLGLLGSVLKLNSSRNDLQQAPTGYQRLLIAAGDPGDFTDPDGTRVSIVEPGDGGVTAVGVEIATDDVAALRAFYVAAMGGEPAGDGDACTIGTTLVRFVHDPSASAHATPLVGAGFRYLTVQVFDVAAEHERIVSLGYDEAMPPRKLGEVAAISFVRDPGGNWIEISQRASLTGDLPERV
jgi:catechol 2,3-dioxygenase-like lactoylglutathione lyase family enzyme